MPENTKGPRQLAIVGGAHIHTPNFLKRLATRADLQVAAVWDHDSVRAQHLALSYQLRFLT